MNLFSIQNDGNRQTTYIVLAVVFTLLAVTTTLIWNNEINILSLTISTFSFLHSHWWGFILFLIIATLRPLVLIPISTFSILSGVFFGFWLGLIVTYLSILASALVAYGVGWKLRHLFNLPLPPKILANHPFESILLLHLTMLPFDILNYFIGSQHIRFRPFILAVAVGMIPGTLSLTSFGASIKLEEILEHGITPAMFDWNYVILAIVIYAVSFAMAKLLKRQPTK